MKLLVFLSMFLLSLNLSAETSQLKLDLMLAKGGDVSAQFSVATAYEFGRDAKKDIKKAFDWYLKAANQSHAPSQYKVGYFYENGLGVAKNVDTAMTWYKKAKANGSDQASKRLNKTAFDKDEKAAKEKRLALQAKLEKEENARQAKEDEDARKAKARQAANDKKAKQQLALAQKAKADAAAKAKAKAAKAAKKQAAVKIPDILKVVLNNKWKTSHGAADFLPSASTTCLESGDKELTCFSSEKSRKVKSSNVTYTAKSTIVGFKSNGSFKVIYNYNGIKIDGPKSNATDVYGLALKEGWQEPSIAINCKASNRKNITCNRGNNKIQFTR